VRLNGDNVTTAVSKLRSLPHGRFQALAVSIVQGWLVPHQKKDWQEQGDMVKHRLANIVDREGIPPELVSCVKLQNNVHPCVDLYLHYIASF
jgi:hypothetical protein